MKKVYAVYMEEFNGSSDRFENTTTSVCCLFAEKADADYFVSRKTPKEVSSYSTTYWVEEMEVL